MCCVAETRHTYPRLERKPGAIPEWDGKSYIIRVPDPAVHSLVPEPYLLRPGLAGPLQGRPTGFHRFVSAWLIHLAFFFFFAAHSCNCLTLDTDLKCHEVVCHSCANVCKPVEWTEGKKILIFHYQRGENHSVKLKHFISFVTLVQGSFRSPGRCLGHLISSNIIF